MINIRIQVKMYQVLFNITLTRQTKLINNNKKFIKKY